MIQIVSSSRRLFVLTRTPSSCLSTESRKVSMNELRQPFTENQKGEYASLGEDEVKVTVRDHSDVQYLPAFSQKAER